MRRGYPSSLLTGRDEWSEHLVSDTGRSAMRRVHASSTEHPESDARCSGGFDFYQRVAVGDASAPVGQGVVGEAVGDLAVGVMATPPAPRDRRQARAQTLRDPDRQLEAGAVVEHARAVALGEATRLGVGGV